MIDLNLPASSGAHAASALRLLHIKLIELMDLVDEIADRPQLDEVQLSSARWKLSTARRETRLLVDGLLEQIGAEVRDAEKYALTELRAAASQALQATARHSAQWNVKAVTLDRLGYRQAVRQLRAQWMAAIHAEQRLLYPLLASGDSAGTRRFARVRPPRAEAPTYSRY